MKNNVIFYIIPDNFVSIKFFKQIEYMSILLILHIYSFGKKILILCDNQKQAYFINEELWNIKNDAFLPHNLLGESPLCGSPIEICWKDNYTNDFKDYVFILTSNIYNVCFDNFNNIIDFVPNKNCNKILSRDRYKFYLSYGYILNIKYFNVL